MRTFHLHRFVDASGVSGTGVIAEGVEFSDGAVTLHWLGEHATTVVWASVVDLEAVHGHGGTTRVVWHDPHERLGVEESQPAAVGGQIPPAAGQGRSRPASSRRGVVGSQGRTGNVRLLDPASPAPRPRDPSEDDG